jgi:hypothetical protein
MQWCKLVLKLFKGVYKQTHCPKRNFVYVLRSYQHGKGTTSLCGVVKARYVVINSSTKNISLMLKVEMATVQAFEVMLTKKK